MLYEDLSKERTTHHMSELIIGMGNHNGHVDRNIDGFHEVRGELALAKDFKREGCYYNIVMQCTYASPTHRLERLTRRQPMDQDVTKRDRFLHNGKSRSQVFFYVKVITGELQHNLVVVDVDKKKKKKKTKRKPESKKCNAIKR